jgi:hypothetical protein
MGSGAAAGASLLPDGGVDWDPLAAQRKSVVAQFCSTLDTYPCLSFEGPALCPAAELVASYSVPDACFSDWVETMKCLAARPYQCPCAIGLDDCILLEPGGSVNGAPPPCGGQALNDCVDRAFTKNTIDGTRLSCLWETPPDGTTCTVYCLALPGVDAGRNEQVSDFSATCSGGPGGPYACDYRLHDQPLQDDLNAFPMYVNDCPSVARGMANGELGVSDVDCCFTGHSVPDAGASKANECWCISNTTLLSQGFSSCTDIAAYSHGDVTSLCPEYLSGFGMRPAVTWPP